MKVTHIKITQDELDKIFEETRYHTEAVQYLIDIPVETELDGILAAVAKSYQNIEDGHYKSAIRLLEVTIKRIEKLPSKYSTNPESTNHTHEIHIGLKKED